MSNKPRNRKTNRVPMSFRVDISTFKAIDAQAIPGKVSQSEVVDRWCKAAELLELIWELDRANLSDTAYYHLESWKESR